jgi:hypothetical protein
MTWFPAFIPLATSLFYEARSCHLATVPKMFVSRKWRLNKWTWSRTHAKKHRNQQFSTIFSLPRLTCFDSTKFLFVLSFIRNRTRQIKRLALANVYITFLCCTCLRIYVQKSTHCSSSELRIFWLWSRDGKNRWRDRPSGLRLSTKLVSTFVDRGCHMFSATVP